MIQQFPELSLWSLWCVFTKPFYLSREELLEAPRSNEANVVRLGGCCAHQGVLCALTAIWKRANLRGHHSLHPQSMGFLLLLPFICYSHFPWLLILKWISSG